MSTNNQNKLLFKQHFNNIPIIALMKVDIVRIV